MAVNIPAGFNNAQSVIDGHPAGTTFYLLPGTHRQTKITPRTGDVYLLDPGALMDGEYVQDGAFNGVPNGNPVNNVTIRATDPAFPGNIYHYKPINNWGAVGGGIPTNNLTSGWVLRDLFVYQNGNNGDPAFYGGSGVRAGRNMTITNCVMNDNDRYGFHGGGVDGAVIDGCVIQNNGWGTGITDGNVGGTKVTVSDNVIIRNSAFQDNNSNGIWFDIDNIGYLIENCTVERNQEHGIFIEISYGGTVRGCTVRDNGLLRARAGLMYDSGINVGHSEGVLIENNLCHGNWKGEGGHHQQNRTHHNTGLNANITNCTWRNNHIVATTVSHNKVTGLETDYNPAVFGFDPFAPASNNRFIGNKYWVPNTGSWWFRWNRANQTFSQWQGFGHDTTGTITFYAGTPPEPGLPGVGPTTYTLATTDLAHTHRLDTGVVTPQGGIHTLEVQDLQHTYLLDSTMLSNLTEPPTTTRDLSTTYLFHVTAVQGPDLKSWTDFFASIINRPQGLEPLQIGTGDSLALLESFSESWGWADATFNTYVNTCSFPSEGAPGGAVDALLVVADAAALTSADTAIQTRLEGQAYTVTAISDETAENYAGMDLIVVSESCSTTLGAKYKTATIPMLHMKHTLWDSCDLVTIEGGAGGTTTNVVLVNAHPIDAGLSGTVGVVNTATQVIRVLDADLPAGAVRVWRSGTNSLHIMGFAYDAGDTGANAYVMPAARVGLAWRSSFINDMTADGWAIFDACCSWLAPVSSGAGLYPSTSLIPC